MIPYFDAHCDTITASGNIAKNCGHLDAERLKAFAPCGQVFAVCCTDDMPGGYKKYLPMLREQIERSEDMYLCLSSDDIKNALDAGKIAAIMAVEGAEHFGCTIGGLKSAFDAGVRSVNLTWNFDNTLSGAAMGSGTGLTDYGKLFVKAAQDMGIILDMSHISERGFWDVLDISERPVYASHSDSLAVCPGVKRNLTDEQFMALARIGGGAGINLYPKFLGLEHNIAAVCAHIEHYLSLGGEKAVFLGTDFDGIEETPAGLSGVQDMPKLYEALLRLNYSEDLVRDIFFNNLLSILERAL